MPANATRELMFHDTIEEDDLRSNPAAQYRAASYQKQSHESRGNLLTNALADHRPQPVRTSLSLALHCQGTNGPIPNAAQGLSLTRTGHRP
jgi:hypothetical protein